VAAVDLDTFPLLRDPPATSDADRLTPGDPKDVRLHYRGRKRVRDADEIMAWIVAERLGGS
jgi:hypothetical protein